MNFPKLIPAKDFVLITDLSSKEIEQRLIYSTNRNTIIKVSFFNILFQKKFSGIISENIFYLERNLIIGESLDPEISGEIHESDQGCELNISLTYRDSAKACIIIWFGLSGIGLIAALISSILNILNGNAEKSNFIILLPLLLIIGGYYYMHFVFESKSEEVIGVLRNFFKANRIEQKNRALKTIDHEE